MIPDVIINNISMLEMGLIRELISMPTPKTQTNTIVVPYRNSPIRYTNLFNDISYQPRNFSLTFSILGSRERFNKILKEISNKFLGVLSKVIISEEPNLYLLGTLQINNEYNQFTHKGTIEIFSDDADAYRYHILETNISITGSGVINLKNDYMKVTPTITTTSETTLSWTIGTDAFNKTVNIGTFIFPELELSYGNNKITVNSTGKTTFKYREGCL